MKRIVSLLTLGLAVVACNNNPEGFTVNGDIRGDLENGTKVYLKKPNATNQLVDADTTEILDGKFKFMGNSEIPEMQYVAIDGIRGALPFVAENGEISISAQKDSVAFMELGGTVQNDLFADFTEGTRQLSDKAMSINQDMRNASMQKDSASMNALQEEFMELQAEAKDYEKGFIRNNPNALVSALLLERAYSTKSIEEAEFQELFSALTPEIKATAPATRIADQLDKSKNTSIGAKAPAFSAPSPEGPEIALYDVLDQVTIVDFWAAWCKPCRAENPNLVRIYEQYKDKGLNIVGVSLDRNGDDWKKAIADDGLAWDQVSNLAYFNDEIAKTYNVQAIPASFILDAEGKIIAKNLRGKALEDKIAELLP